MKRTALKRWNSALRVIVATAALGVSTLTFTGAHADDRIGIVLSASPSGAATNAITMRLASEATGGSVPIFLRQTTDSTLYAVVLLTTPLVDEKGVVSVTPSFDKVKRTLPSGGELRRADVTVSGLKTFGTFKSTLYATHGTKTQTLGVLTVVHIRRGNPLQIAPIQPARSEQWFPATQARVTLLVTVKNIGESDALFSAPVIADLTSSGGPKTQAGVPSIRVVERDGRPVSGGFTIAAGGATTLKLVLDNVKKTGSYAGTLRVAAIGFEPVEQSFGFAVKQGPAFPVALIALGVAVAYLIRRRYSSGRIARAGQRRLVARLLSDLSAARVNVGDLEPRERLVLETLERRLVDISDEIEFARVSKKSQDMSEIDHKVDLFLDLVVARKHVRAMTPGSLQIPFESELNQGAAFLMEVTPPRELETRFGVFSKTITEMPPAVEATVRERFQSDVDRFLAAAESSAAISEALPLRVLKRVATGKELADAGRFGEARAELGAAQLTFARILAEDFMARIPDQESGPPGFVSGWPRFRADALEVLRAVRRERRGERAAKLYRKVWQEYVDELATRLRASASRERRGATAARKEQLAKVVEACGEVSAKALELDPSAIDAYMRAVEAYLAPAAQKRSAGRLRSLLEAAQLPPPLTILAAGLADAERLPRPSPRAAESAASLTRQIRKRHVSLALIGGVVAIPAGLALLWAPNDTWGNLTDGATIFGWGLGLQALTATLDARRLGWSVSRAAASARQSGATETVATLGVSSRIRPEREPAS